MLRNFIGQALRMGAARVAQLADPARPRFECPACGWSGIFLHFDPPTGHRSHAQCPKCNALERHRLQKLVVDEVFSALRTREMRMLHFAPEPFFTQVFRPMFGGYETADIAQPDVDHHVDLQALPFADASYDIVYASHVLEHVPDDRAALREISRILRPGGLAILPVPIVAERTIEYDEPNPVESMHVRAPGPDYFDRYAEVFSRIQVFDSGRFPERHQVHVFEHGRSGERGVPDYVPVCHR